MRQDHRPLGSVNFTAFALSFKADGCDTAECACVLSSSLAMATALHQAGLNKAKILFAAGPTQDIFQSKADEAAAKGAYFPGISSSPTYSNAASLAFLADLKKYDPAYKGGLPGNSESDGWPGANLMVEGLKVAGTNPTRQSFIAGLRKVTNWTDSGLATGPISFAHFGQKPAHAVLQLCAVQRDAVRALPEERQAVLREADSRLAILTRTTPTPSRSRAQVLCVESETCARRAPLYVAPACRDGRHGHLDSRNVPC